MDLCQHSTRYVVAVIACGRGHVNDLIWQGRRGTILVRERPEVAACEDERLSGALLTRLHSRRDIRLADLEC
jgi:hypothetical protein